MLKSFLDAKPINKRAIQNVVPTTPSIVLALFFDISLKLYLTEKLKLFQNGSFSNTVALLLLGCAGLNAAAGAILRIFFTESYAAIVHIPVIASATKKKYAG